MMTPENFESASESVRKSLRLYLTVGLILFCGTVATVAVATVPFLDVGDHGFDKWDALLGVMIAATKAALVAAIFMHLNHERRLIYGLIGLGAVHGVGLFIGTYWHFADMTHDTFFYDHESAPQVTLEPPDPATAAVDPR
jgi:cytochrome c oxidase subunit IV